MADDKSNRDGQDRARMSAEESYEVEYFANKHEISAQQARHLIGNVGNDRAKLDAAAEELLLK